MATYQNNSCFEFEQSSVYLNASVQNIYNVFYSKTSSMYIFNAIKKQSGIRFIVDALFGYFAYLHNLYTVVQLHTNFVLIHFETQSICIVLNGISFCQEYDCLQNVSCFVFEQSIGFHNTAVQNICNVCYRVRQIPFML